MPTPTPTFQRLELTQFEALLTKFPFTRKVNAVHMHHTWRPRRADFQGHKTILSMWRHHTQENGWSDIAQHITIAPDGAIWLGRNWNLPPASASGHNGNSVAGPFMFEMVGDFDVGQEPFDGPQKATALKVIALVQRRFGLRPATLRFHNMMSTKTCPGSSIDYDETVNAVEELHAHLEAAAAPEGERTTARSPFPEEDAIFLQQAIRALTRVTDNRGERGDVEHEHTEDPARALPRAGTAARAGSGLDAASLADMRPHLVNLRSGMFSTEGEFSSTPQDVDAMFEEHLPRAIGALPSGRKLQLLFFAHGGLVSEASGLERAHQHIAWWRRNGVYPVYFIWETGFFESIGQLLERARGGTRAVTRDLADHTTDPLMEFAARLLQGPRIWGGMKWSAERAVQADGGAQYVARKLKELCQKHGGAVDLHAVGHSAGSIFHAHFLPTTQGPGVPVFKTLQFLAPAIRVDTFKDRLLDGLKKGELASEVSIFTMRRDHERDDDCAGIYRKSLLYLIFHALEDETRTPILGLEESLRGDPDTKQFFGLGGAGGQGEVVWSRTDGDTGRSASQAAAHGDFDDDAPTMNSVARRVLDLPDAAPIEDFPAGAREVQRAWTQEVDWPDAFLATPVSAAPAAAWHWPWQKPPAPPAPAPSAWSAPPAPTASGGRRIALCMGVDAYPDPQHRLAGCVNDARTWAGALAGLGFETRMLLDGQATRSGMDRELRRLVAESRAGDVLVVQYAGHGTHVNDLDGDEADGRDEALCPVDFASGALYIDDDIAEVFALLPEGVNLTVFMDCCHSGTNTRFAVGLQPGTALPADVKARFVPPTTELQHAHARFRGGQRGLARNGGTGGPGRMRHVKFSACQDSEVALESGGNGEFTRRAVRVLGHGAQGLSNGGFLQAVLTEFGSGARQNPMLDCAEPSRAWALLQPLAGGGPAGAMQRAAPADASLVHAVQALAETVQVLSRRISP